MESAAAGSDRRRGAGRRGTKSSRDTKSNEWIPVTKLGKLVKAGKIRSIEEIYLCSMPIKEYQIIEHFFPGLVENVVEIMPVQKQTQAGQRTRFKAIVVVGDMNGHVGLGVKCAKEVATAIRGAVIAAKLSLTPVRRGYWGTALGEPHTIPLKTTGKCGSVVTRLIPAPKGTGIVAASVTKGLLQLAGIKDCYTSTTGKTRTTGNFVASVFEAVSKTYRFLTPDMWPKTRLNPTLFELHSEFLSK